MNIQRSPEQVAAIEFAVSRLEHRIIAKWPVADIHRAIVAAAIEIIAEPEGEGVCSCPPAAEAFVYGHHAGCVYAPRGTQAQIKVTPVDPVVDFVRREAVQS